MSYTTTKLITNAYYIAGIVSRDFETVSGQQVSDGLELLNDIIQDKDVQQSMLPYEGFYSFNAIPNQEKYFIPNLIQIDTIVFFKDSVRYSMLASHRDNYFGSPRIESVQTLPFTWYFERSFGGGFLYLYFKPDQSYKFDIHGTFRLSRVKLDQDLDSNISQYNLGIPSPGVPSLAGVTSTYEDYSLAPGQLIVNNVDLTGSYLDLGAFINYVNSGVIPGVKAYVSGTQVYLESTEQNPKAIHIETSGYPPNGTQFRKNVRLATNVNLDATYDNGSGTGILATLTANSNGALSVDGISVAVGNFILVKSQNSQLENGIYRVVDVGSATTPYILTRDSAYDSTLDIKIGDLFYVEEGNVNAFSIFVQTDSVSFVGVSPIEFDSFSALTFSNFSTIGYPNFEASNPLGIDEFYINYLKYALANRLCVDYNYATPENLLMQLKKYQSWIDKESRRLDMRVNKVTTFRRGTPGFWGYANLGRGYYTGGY
jgi:hypothetical protein